MYANLGRGVCDRCKRGSVVDALISHREVWGSIPDPGELSRARDKHKCASISSRNCQYDKSDTLKMATPLYYSQRVKMAFRIEQADNQGITMMLDTEQAFLHGKAQYKKSPLLFIILR